MRRVLITGITGFVGSHLADLVLAKDEKIELFGTRRWHLSRMENVRSTASQINWIDCDLTDPIGTRKMLEKANPDWIFHCAAESFVSPSWNHPNRYMDANYGMTVNLLDGLMAAGSDARIHIPGSGEEYGDVKNFELPITPETPFRPVNPYAVTKIAQDLIAYVYHRSYALNVIRTRSFNHEGPRRMNVFGIPWYAYQIARAEKHLQEPKLRVGHIDDKRNFTHVRDMVEAYWLAMERCVPGELYLVGSEDAALIHTFREALEMLMEMSTIKDLTYEIDSEFVRPTNVPYLIADIGKFKAATGWSPKTDFSTILSETLEYWRERVEFEATNG